MNKKFIGLDVCKDCVVAWVIDDTPPRNHKQYWREKCQLDERSRKHEEDPLTFFYCENGIKGLLALGGDVWVIEPTGGHYSELIEKVAAAENVELLKVAHTQSAHYRAEIKLPDKNDLADAYALGRYGQLYYGVDDHFVTINSEIKDLKRLYLQSKSISRFRTPLINRLRQQLSHEFPEAMNVSTETLKDGRRAFICWLAKRCRTKTGKTRWDNQYKKSIAHKYGIGISDFTRELAKKIDDFDILDFKISQQINELVYQDKFSEYNAIFDDFNFGVQLRAILISTIYPFSGNYPTMAQFKKRIGCALEESSSGSSEAWKTGKGSALCRSELYLWVFTVVKQLKRRPQSKAGKKVVNKYDDWMDKFNQNPLEYLKNNEKNTVKKLLKILKEFISPEILKLVELQLNQEIDLKDKPKITKDIKKKFSNLVMGKTIGYTGRILYRELTRRLKD